MSAANNTFLLGSRLYVVKTSAVLVVDGNGRRRMLRKGDIVPPSTVPSQIEHLVAQGMIEATEVNA